MLVLVTGGSWWHRRKGRRKLGRGRRIRPGRNSENVTEKWEMCRKWGISVGNGGAGHKPSRERALHWPEVLGTTMK